MESFLKALGEGVLIPVLTAVAAAWWKGLSKPAQATGEDRLLAFEHLVAAAALVIIQFVRAWTDPLSSKNLLGVHGLIFLVLVVVLLGSAHAIKERFYRPSQEFYLTRYLNSDVQIWVYELAPSVAVRLSVLAALFLLAVFLVTWFANLLF
jgi:hypothetical protein